MVFADDLENVNAQVVLEVGNSHACAQINKNERREPMIKVSENWKKQPFSKKIIKLL